MDTITAIIPYSIKHIKLVGRAVYSIKDQVDKVIARPDYPPKGQIYRLNEMISEVDTDWVLFQDADDFSLANRVEKCRPYMKNADLIYTDCVTKKDKIKSRPFDIEELRKVHYIPFPTIMVRTHIAKEIPFPDVPNGRHDALWAHLVYQKYKRFVYVPVVTVCYNLDTSTYRSKIPFYRKLKRIYYQGKAKKQIEALYVNN